MEHSAACLPAQPENMDLEKLFENIKGPVRRLLKSKVHRNHVDDLFQDVCVNVLRSVDGHRESAKSFKEPDQYMTWVYSITHTRILDHYQSEDYAHGMRLSEAVGGGGESREDLSAAQIREHIGTLRGPSHDVAVLHFLMGLPAGDIGKTLALNISTVKSHIQKARAWIQERR